MTFLLRYYIIFEEPNNDVSDGGIMESSVKILGISASPHGNGSHSDKLLESLMEQASQFGGQTEIIRLVEKQMLVCEGCYKPGKWKDCTYPCIHTEDDTAEILQAIISADALVFATPVHWAGTSSLLQVLLEKMTAVENNRQQIYEDTGREPLEGKPFVGLASQMLEGGVLALTQLVWVLSNMGMFPLPYGLIVKPAALNRPVVRWGLHLIGEGGLEEFIKNNLHLAARNLVGVVKQMRGYKFDDYLYTERTAY